MFSIFLSLFAKYFALSYELAKFIKVVNFYNIAMGFYSIPS